MSQRKELAELQAGLENLLGGVLIAIGLIVFYFVPKVMDGGFVGGAICGVIGGICILGGRRLYMRAKVVIAANHEVISATKDAVIYLRSFGLDSNEDIGAGVIPSLVTEEELLVEAISWVGPVIAVGKPDEQLPPLGATRLHFQQAEWQQQVQKLLTEARLVVLRPGSFSPGVRWEIKEALHDVQPARLLLIIDGEVGKHQDAELAQFAAQVNPMLPRPLVLSYPKKPLYPFGSVRAFVGFDDNWRPSLLPVALDLLPILKRGGRFRVIVKFYREALRGPLTSLGYPPPRPGVSVVMVGIFGMCVAIFIFFLYALVITLSNGFTR